MKKCVSLLISSFLIISLILLSFTTPKNNKNNVLVEHSLTVRIVGEGEVSPANGSYSDIVNLKAIPSTGYKFAGWSGDLAGPISTIALVMGSDKKVTASFVAEDAPMHTVTTTMEGAGRIIKSKTIALEGEMVYFYAIPDAGYRFTNWSGNYSGDLNPVSIPISKDISIRAIFQSISPLSYYVSVMGDDNDLGDIESPFATIGKALSVSVPGDIIFIMPGVYESKKMYLSNKSGEPGNPIHIVAHDPNIKPIIKAGLEVSRCSYLYFKGIEITKTKFNSCGIGSHHNIYENFDVHHVLNSQVAFDMCNLTHDNIIINCDFHHNVLFEGSNADGIAMWGDVESTNGPYNNSLFSCRSFFNNDDGFDTWWAGSNNHFDSCWAYGNGRDSTFSDIDGDGNGFKLGAGYGSCLLTNCLSWKNKMIGISQNGNKGGGHSIYNCTTYDNSYLNFAFWQVPASSEIINCISYESNIDISVANDQYNSWNLNNIDVNDDDFVSLDFSWNIGDRNPDGSLPESNFLKLMQDSDLIDKGKVVGIPFLGSAPDIGAYEYIQDTINSIYSFKEVFVFQNYPNPYSDHTTFTYEVSNMSHVKLVIYNLNGEEIAVLIDQKQQPGKYSIKWNPGYLSQVMNNQSIYLSKISIGSVVQIRKIIHIGK